MCKKSKVISEEKKIPNVKSNTLRWYKLIRNSLVGVHRNLLWGENIEFEIWMVKQDTL